MAKNAFFAASDDVMLFRLDLDPEELGYLRSLLEGHKEDMDRMTPNKLADCGQAPQHNAAVLQLLDLAAKLPHFRKRALVQQDRKLEMP